MSEINLLPVLDKAITPDSTPYTSVAVWLSLSPRIDLFETGVIDATASITWRPIRQLPDGRWELAPESMAKTENIGSAREAMKADPAMAKAIMTIAGVLQEMLAGG